MARLGGVAYRYLSHQDELGESLVLIRQRFGTKLGGHIREQSEFAVICSPTFCSISAKRIWATSTLFQRQDTHQAALAF